MPTDKAKCAGCRDDFYNGKNPLGVTECWSLKSAALVKKIRIHRDERPPYTQAPIEVYDCRHEQGYVLVFPTALTDAGYWK
jgi:hypothetical protein